MELIGHKEAQCIAVDAPDHLYVTEEYIVTHNTTVGLCAAELLRHAPSFVSDAYCGWRLAPSSYAGAAFGTVRDAAAAAILSRALPG